MSAIVSPPLPIIAPEATAGTNILRLTAGPAILAAPIAPPFITWNLKYRSLLQRFWNGFLSKLHIVHYITFVCPSFVHHTSEFHHTNSFRRIVWTISNLKMLLPFSIKVKECTWEYILWRIPASLLSDKILEDTFTIFKCKNPGNVNKYYKQSVYFTSMAQFQAFSICITWACLSKKSKGIGVNHFNA